MNHVVITGGAGFIGSHLCRALLDRGDHVTAVDDLRGAGTRAIADLLEYPLFTLRTTDVTALGAFAELDTVTHVVHLAGGTRERARHPVDAIRTASTGTLAVLDLGAAHDARIVIVSGPRAREEPRGHRPAAHSGPDGDCARMAIELITEAAARHYPGANVAIARPFEVYGPHLWPGRGVSAAICAAALRDQTIHLDDEARSFVYVADTVAALVALLDSDTPGPVDVGAQPTRLAEFARTAVEIAGSGWVEVCRSTPSHPTPRQPDLTRTKALLGWQPATPLHTGLHHTVNWMQTTLRRRGAPP
ncbi:NAD-dependent epimerase/dehydratase family protein [Nocardia sp. NPDC059180]|uniref:NAD-dependent epimerase/dehydratase family protein n=1 Tax=Nocardia sp. NPDC059180 TaxID=3346761 RepID=UPI0036D1E9F3